MEVSALPAPARLTGISLPVPLLRLRSDDQLVALFRAGSDEAFRVIHDRYRQRLFAYMRQMLAGSRQDAEDALQDVFLRAHAALRANERPISLRAWLYRVAHNRCIDQLRRPVPVPLEGVELVRSALPDPLAEAERREDLRRLVADVRRLPDQQRSVLLMREVEGASYADLAEAHGVSVAAVKSLLVRARIGLVQAAEARDVACIEIRTDLAAAHHRGVRATGRARRHLRDCSTCRDFRTALQASRRELAGINPGGPLASLAKLLGLGAGSGGAAAGSSAAAGGGAAASGGAVAGSGAAAATVCKVAAVVCSTDVAAGGAMQVERQLTGTSAGSAGREAVTLASPAGQRAASTSVATESAQSPSQRAAAAAQSAAPSRRRGAGDVKRRRAPAKPTTAPVAVPENDFPYGIAEDPPASSTQSPDEAPAAGDGATVPLKTDGPPTTDSGTQTGAGTTAGDASGFTGAGSTSSATSAGAAAGGASSSAGTQPATGSG